MDARERASRECNAAHEWQELKAEREAKRKAEAAPDREKLLALADQIERMLWPECHTENGKIIIGHLKERNQGVAEWLRRKVGEL